MRRADIEVPNPAVAVDAWAGSACYPRGTFYPLSDGPSIWNRRITKADFRLCSTCLSHSQAGFCLYTLQVISKTAAPNHRPPPFNFRMRPPQSNYPPDSVPLPDDGSRLESKRRKGGI